MEPVAAARMPAADHPTSPGASADTHQPAAARPPLDELARLRNRVDQQEHSLAVMAEAISALRDGSQALRAENRGVSGAERAARAVDNDAPLVAPVLPDLAPAVETASQERFAAVPSVPDEQRSSALTAMLLREVRESRARIQAAADAERRRIENDLHDGAQQRLIAIQIKLTLVAETLDDTAAELLRALQIELEDAIEEIRSLALGVHPPALERHGLVDALRLVATRSPLPIAVRAACVGRYSREIEAAAYFCCLEAIQNATKHARDAKTVFVDLTDAGALRFRIRDDGAGFDAASATTGRGLTSMRDRLDAVGGHLTIESQPGHGTRVIATIPQSAAAPRAA